MEKSSMHMSVWRIMFQK